MMSFENKLQTLGLPIPDCVFQYSEEKQNLIYEYLQQMDDIHKKAYLIAKDHLGTSFNILKSNGYKEWIKSKQ